jgi:hypothetical protein
MTNIITLTNASLSTSTAVKLLNGDFTYSWKNLTKIDAGEGFFGNVEAQMNGWENPALNLRFYIPIDNLPSGAMSWELWNEFAKYQYDGTNQTILSVAVGSSDTSFKDYSASTATSGVSSIPVIVRSYALKFSPADSRDSAFWTIDAQLQVTK